MAKELTVSLEQWRALIAVIEEGGYAKAAEALGKSQSTVSYAIGQLEQSLNLAIFRIQGRKAVPTSAGNALYQRARHLLAEAESIENAAERLGQRIEPEVRIAADLLVPGELVMSCLDEFSDLYPSTRVDVLESALSGTEDALVQKQVDIAITGNLPAGFMGDYLGSVALVGVAAPGHPLHQLGRCITQDDLRHYRQLIVRDTGARRRYSAGWQEAEQRWTFSHISTSLAAVKKGLGFAWLPEGYLAQSIESGEIKPLPVTEGVRRVVPLYLVYSDQDIAGPATRALGKIFQERLAHTKRAGE